MTYTLEEQKAHRRDLVAALRSGKYQQGHWVLRSTSNLYCCLGVACEVAGIPSEFHDNAYPYFTNDDWYSELGNGGGYYEAISLPPMAMEYFGFKDSSGIYDKFITDNNQGQKYSLMYHNDTENLTFNEIADIIESEPEGLFV